MGARWKSVLRRIPVAKSAWGLVTCTAAASGFTVFFRDTHGNAAPLIFLLVVGLVAWFWGTLAAMVGLVTGSVIFARFLFPSIGKFTIAAESAPQNVAMMLLFGIAVAYFYGYRSPS
jgi:K+-sensing histidine kinase KdpD